MTVLLKAAAAGVAGSIAALVIKRSAPELGMALSLAVCLLAAALAMELISGLTDLVSLVRDEMSLSPAVSEPVVKCVGIGIVTRLSADMCKDAGQSAAASAVELCGAACALAAALPLLRALLELITELA